MLVTRLYSCLFRPKGLLQKHSYDVDYVVKDPNKPNNTEPIIEPQYKFPHVIRRVIYCFQTSILFKLVSGSYWLSMLPISGILFCGLFYIFNMKWCELVSEVVSHAVKVFSFILISLFFYESLLESLLLIIVLVVNVVCKMSKFEPDSDKLIKCVCFDDYIKMSMSLIGLSVLLTIGM